MLTARNFRLHNSPAKFKIILLVIGNLNIELAAAHDLHVIDADDGQFVVLGKKVAKRFEIGDDELRRKLIVDLAVFLEIGFQVFRRCSQS